jgi:hypothetical protein
VFDNESAKKSSMLTEKEAKDKKLMGIEPNAGVEPATL